jgi:hypothetical protein
VVIGGYLLATGHRAGGHLIAAGLLFAVSLTFRSIDRLICQDTAGIVTPEPIGTHFMWHVLNALLLYLLLRAAILYGAGVDVRRQRAVAA